MGDSLEEIFDGADLEKLAAAFKFENVGEMMVDIMKNVEAAGMRQAEAQFRENQKIID